MITAIFDDHYHSFVTWRENGLRDLTCVHIDAHLDVMSRSFSDSSLKAIAEAKTAAELEVFRGDARLPWGGFHCGNYLYPALKDGTVKELIWVVPPHVIAGETFVDGVRQECQKWLDFRLEEYRSLRSVNGAVVGKLAGCDFTVCTADNFPELSLSQRSNLALDIDVDYFVRNSDDKIWQTPHDLFRKLGNLEPKVLTVAYSVDGGYTPLQDRYLGKVTLDVFGEGDESKWEVETAKLLEIDELDDGEKSESYSAFLKSAPDWLKPAILLRMGKGDEAIAYDPEYTLRPLNVASRFLNKKEFDQGLALLQKIETKELEALYIHAYLCLGKSDAVLAYKSLQELLQRLAPESLERSQILMTLAQACQQLGRDKECLTYANEALTLEPKSAELYFLLANSHRKMGAGKKAAKAVRKALRLAKGWVSSLPIMLEAAQIYDELGQAALAKATRLELEKIDESGRFAIRALLDESKL